MSEFDISQKSSDDEIDLAELFTIFWLKKWFIILITLSVTGVGYFVVDQMPEIYRASSTIMVKSDKAKNPLSSLMGGAATSNEQLDTTIKLLKSHQFAKSIVEMLDTPSSLLFSQLGIDWGEQQLQQGLTISTVKNTNMLEISYESQFPEFTALVVNTIANNFVSYQANLMRPDTEQSGQWINEKITDVQQQLQLEEQKLKQYQQDHDVVDIKALVKLNKQEIALLHKELRVLKQKQEAVVRVQGKIESANNDNEKFLTISEIAQLPVIKSLIQQRTLLSAQLSQIKLRYLHKHPKYIAINNKIIDIDKQIARQITVIKAKDRKSVV